MADKTNYIGRTIDGKYQILEKIGQGGMGAVYRARHVLMDRTVAIKLMRLHLADDDEATRRFQHEAKAASRIEHPNAVTIYDFGIADEGLYYIAMEYIEGASLKQVMQESGPMDVARAVPIVKQVCSVLAEAHRMGVVHRDIKPENIMLCQKADKKDIVKVLDFGIAKIMKEEGSSKLTQTGMVFGTPKYMSPEQIQGKQLDGRSDIYALGCVLYEMLTGKTPFEAEGDLELLLQHLNAEPRPFRETAANPSVTAEIERVVLKALSKDRDGRLSADDLARELDFAITSKMDRGALGLTTAAPPPPPPPPPSPAPLATWTEKTEVQSAQAYPPPPPQAMSYANPLPPPPPALGATIVSQQQMVAPFPAPVPRPSNALPIALAIGGLVVVLGAAGAVIYYKRVHPAPAEQSSTTQEMPSTSEPSSLDHPPIPGQTPAHPSGPTGEPTSSGPGPSDSGSTPQSNGAQTSPPPPLNQPPASPSYQRLSNDAVTQARGGHLDQAHQILLHALQLQPASPELHFNLAQVLIMEKRNADAIGELQLYMKYQPGASDRSQVENLIQALRDAGRP